MRSDRVVKHFALALVLALMGYAAFYQGIEYLRTRRGAWQVAFTANGAGTPVIVINQLRLGITNVQIAFPGESLPASKAPSAFAAEHSLSGDSQSTNANYLTSTTVLFAQPKAVPYDVPFGKCVFMDTTFLPGTVTLQLFGHEIELLPRVLMVDHEEHAWMPNGAISFSARLPARSPPKP
jgi:hypothetical protein